MTGCNYGKPAKPLRHHGDLEDLPLAAWATFFLRYTDPRFSSAREKHQSRRQL
jgi:hypothetical protein